MVVVVVVVRIVTRARPCGCRFAPWPHSTSDCRDARRKPHQPRPAKQKDRLRFTLERPRRPDEGGRVYVDE